MTNKARTPGGGEAPASRAIIGLINPKSPENVAAVLRAAGNFRADAVCYTGKRYPLALQRNPDMADLRRRVGRDMPLSGTDDLFELAHGDMKIVCVELAENALALPAFHHPHEALYIFGPEDGTIDQPTIDRADAVVYIPTAGCLNLAAAVTVLLYDRASKLCGENPDNELIRRNRDTNNRLKVR
jgi:tRNA(Leu) C34 or U34 (ribose-2'-O)-methylase TrmL